MMKRRNLRADRRTEDTSSHPSILVEYDEDSGEPIYRTKPCVSNDNGDPFEWNCTKTPTVMPTAIPTVTPTAKPTVNPAAAPCGEGAGDGTDTPGGDVGSDNDTDSSATLFGLDPSLDA